MQQSTTKPILLTKSKYTMGLKCLKSLWITFHEPEKRPEIGPELQNRFDQGHIVGNFAKKLFPDGIEVEQESFTKNIELSKNLISKRKPLFEAGFMSGSIYARADVLAPAGNDEWDIIEVKSSTKVKDDHIEDVAFQKLCYEKAGLKIRKCFVMCINNQYIRHGEIEPSQLFVTEDVTAAVDKIHDVEVNIEKMLQVISSKEPPKHCSDPSDCPLKEECWGFLPKNSVFRLYRGGKKCLELYNNGVLAIKDIPKDFKLSTVQKIQFKCEATKKPYVKKAEIKKFLASRKYPLHFLDFETYNLPIPLFDGLRPYQQVPFQFSLHIQRSEDSDLEHYSFLADGTQEDPRRKFMEALRKTIGSKGNIVVFNEAFEKMILKNQANAFPEFREWVESLTPRFNDLLMPFRNFHYYHPDQEGSASIKKVLPALTGKSYDDMEIAAGGDASALFLTITLGKLSHEQAAKVRYDLEKYCFLDTEAMVLIMGELEKVA